MPDIQSLIIDLSEKTLAQIEAAGRQIYTDLYAGQSVESHDGEPVFFFNDTFDHAFFTSSDRIRHPYDKDKVVPERVERIQYVGPVIQGKIDGVSCWLTPSPPPQKGYSKRLYVVHVCHYIIWLEPQRRGGWKFSTAYVAEPRYISRVCGEGKRIWVRKG